MWHDTNGDGQAKSDTHQKEQKSNSSQWKEQKVGGLVVQPSREETRVQNSPDRIGWSFEDVERRSRYYFCRSCIPRINRAHDKGQFPEGHGAKNRSVCGLVNPFIKIRSPRARQSSRENWSNLSNLSSYDRWRRPKRSLAADRCSPSIFLTLTLRHTVIMHKTTWVVPRGAAQCCGWNND